VAHKGCSRATTTNGHRFVGGREALLRTREFGGDAAQRAWVLPLHGGLPPDEQKRVFEHPPHQPGGDGGGGGDGGVVKVILATNVAETSVTIDDVGFVVDAGRVKEERYDAARRMVRDAPREDDASCAARRALGGGYSRLVPKLPTQTHTPPPELRAER